MQKENQKDQTAECPLIAAITEIAEQLPANHNTAEIQQYIQENAREGIAIPKCLFAAWMATSATVAADMWALKLAADDDPYIASDGKRAEYAAKVRAIMEKAQQAQKA